jgi:hypothetical protein
MRSLSSLPPLVCTSCEGPIAGRAEYHVGLPFCCAGCVVGGPCTCSYDDVASDAAGQEPPVREQVALPA